MAPDSTETAKFIAFLESPIGGLVVQASNTGVCEIKFVTQRPPWPSEGASGNDLTAAAGEQLSAYFTGKLRNFDLPLDEAGTEFQCAVWAQLRALPFGDTASYGEIAKAIGNPSAARAVGMANHRNPLPIVTPCHRVIGSNGALTGFAGGLDIKRWLLSHESFHRASV